MITLTREQAHHIWQVRKWFKDRYGRKRCWTGTLYHFETMLQQVETKWNQAGKNPNHSGDYNYFKKLYSFTYQKIHKHDPVNL